MKTDNATSSFVVESSITSIRVTIHRRKQWGWFLLALPELLPSGACLLLIVLLLIGSIQAKMLILGTVMLILLGFWLLVMYRIAFEAFEFLFDKETIEVNDQSITVEWSGFLGLRSRKMFSAENIRGLTIVFYRPGQLKFLGRVIRLPFLSSKSVAAFIIWHGRKFIRFSLGTDVSQAEALSFVNTVYLKFPRYRYTPTS